ncbi:hypothetical protein G7Z17_g5515 [Cylindrodendrum hubeiense]|uniref:Amino acid permease/ SLC12A domain-containing protein n=1 Tax=Cylindrodendrum hubeiense TaxID=595255 RepID=A0A9P5LHR4_9HYPO|nr:hypothetical protein G7Z17_g5515 [Cylindrodendrum hubeiense]
MLPKTHDADQIGRKLDGSKENGLQEVQSLKESQAIDIEDDRNGKFHRSFTPRQVHIISLGSNIGSGVFIGTGKALALGGPGNMVIAYLAVCSCVWAVLQTLFEMTIAFPTSGNFIDYTDRWVDPALAFGAGFAEWLVTIFIVVTAAIFFLPNKAFAWFEYITSLIKVALFVLIIILGIALVAGAGPEGSVHDGSNWTELPAFKNGFFGFANCALLATWAVGDQVFIGIMGGEAESPRFSMGHAAKLVPFRVNFVFMASVIFIGILVPSNDDRLLGGSGVTASPFIIAVNDAGISGIPDILNAGMITGILAIAAEGVYLSSRVLRTMAHQKLIPEVLAKVDSRGRPRWALAITLATSILLTYLNLTPGGITAFNWLVSITSASFFVNWMIICLTSWRFHQALVAQNDSLLSEVYAWKSWMWPTAPGWLMTVSTLLLVSCIAAGVGDLRVTDFDIKVFLQYMVGIIIIVSFTLAYKIIMRTPWRDPKTADLVTGRRTLSEAEISQLDAYYSMPRWRRFGTYVQVW